MTLPLALRRVRSAPARYLRRIAYDHAATFVTGFDAAHAYTFTTGLEEWIRSRFGWGRNIAWCGSLQYVVGGDTTLRDDAARVERMFALLDEFAKMRRKRGVAAALLEYGRWERTQPFYRGRLEQLGTGGRLQPAPDSGLARIEPLRTIGALASYPAMVLMKPTFGLAVEFLDGFDAAWEGGLLRGLREWLVVKVDGEETAHWSELVRSWCRSDLASLRGQKREASLIAKTVECVDALWRERKRIDGLRWIFEDHAGWLAETKAAPRRKRP